jgi:hypothetical protein
MKPDETLLAYWLDELDPDEAAEVEAHLFECDDCGARLRELLRLRDAVKREFLAGPVSSAVGTEFIGGLRDDGLRVREYALAPGGSVACTVAPDDDLVVARLGADLAGVRQLDVEYDDAGGVRRSRHIPFDAAQGEVTLVAPTAVLKSLGVSTQVMRLYAVTLDSERLLGEYTFNHSPWEMGTVPIS